MIAERTERGRADRRHRPWRPIRSAAGPAASRARGARSWSLRSAPARAATTPPGSFPTVRTHPPNKRRLR